MIMRRVEDAPVGDALFPIWIEYLKSGDIHAYNTTKYTVYGVENAIFDSIVAVTVH